MNERIVYKALVYHALPWLRTVHATLPRAESRLQIGNEKVNHKKWRPVQVPPA